VLVPCGRCVCKHSFKRVQNHFRLQLGKLQITIL